MNSIILNEKDYAETCLDTGSITEKPHYTIKVLASYFYYELGYSKKRIEVELIDFLERCSPKYRENMRYWHPIVEDISKRADKYKLYQVDGVWITKKELAEIDKIKWKKIRKVAFVLLCLAKFENAKNPDNVGWVNFSYGDIFKLARYNCKHKDRCLGLGKIYRAGLIALPVKITNTALKVVFIDETAGSNESDIFINDFRELGYLYQKLTGDDIVNCEGCGVLIPNSKKRNRKYCAVCAGRVPIQYKSIICAECGKVFVRSVKSRQIRCIKCAEIDRKRTNRNKMRKWRKRNVTIVQEKV